MGFQNIIFNIHSYLYSVIFYPPGLLSQKPYVALKHGIFVLFCILLFFLPQNTNFLQENLSYLEMEDPKI